VIHEGKKVESSWCGRIVTSRAARRTNATAASFSGEYNFNWSTTTKPDDD